MDGCSLSELFSLQDEEAEGGDGGRGEGAGGEQPVPGEVKLQRLLQDTFSVSILSVIQVCGFVFQVRHADGGRRHQGRGSDVTDLNSVSCTYEKTVNTDVRRNSSSF